MCLIGSKDAWSDKYVNKFESRNSTMQQRTIANVNEIKKSISDTNI